MNDFVDLECDMIFGNDIIFDTPKKQTDPHSTKLLSVIINKLAD